MERIADQSYLLRHQYKDASNLEARIGLHERFSTNAYGWPRWALDRVLPHVPADGRVLELGCGPGTLWRENVGRAPSGWEVTLSDFSPGMLAEARRNLSDAGRPFLFAQVDARHIPYPDDSFDAVIANHMLYHVPDRARAFDEVRRVLRPDGRFFAATNGQGHMRELEEFVPAYRQHRVALGFDLEHGAVELAPWFAHVEPDRYEDALEVTEAVPLLDYLFSMRLAVDIEEADRAAIAQEVERRLAADGVIRIGKDVGLFVAWGAT